MLEGVSLDERGALFFAEAEDESVDEGEELLALAIEEGVVDVVPSLELFDFDFFDFFSFAACNNTNECFINHCDIATRLFQEGKTVRACAAWCARVWCDACVRVRVWARKGVALRVWAWRVRVGLVRACKGVCAYKCVCLGQGVWAWYLLLGAYVWVCVS